MIYTGFENLPGQGNLKFLLVIKVIIFQVLFFQKLGEGKPSVRKKEFVEELKRQAGISSEQQPKDKTSTR